MVYLERKSVLEKHLKLLTSIFNPLYIVTVKAWLSLFCGYWYVLLSPLLYWFGVFFSSEVELRPYTPAACSLMTFWAEYKVEVAVVLVALPGAARVLPQLLPRASLSMICTCPEAPFCPASRDGCSQRASCVSCGQAYRWKAVLTVHLMYVCVDLCFVYFISWVNSSLYLLPSVSMWLARCLTVNKWLNRCSASPVLLCY